MENGKSPLAGWTFVCMGGSPFIGVRIPDANGGVALEPFYELSCNQGPTPDGKSWIITHIAVLPFGSWWMKRLDVSSSALVRPIEEVFDADTRGRILITVNQMDTLRTVYRAKAAGVVIEPNMSNVPKKAEDLLKLRNG